MAERAVGPGLIQTLALTNLLKSLNVSFQRVLRSSSLQSFNLCVALENYIQTQPTQTE